MFIHKDYEKVKSDLDKFVDIYVDHVSENIL